jgi:succinoglycan biosynthesis protein ExoH
MTANTDIRARIDMLRFLLIVGLVLLHYGAFPSSDVSPFEGFKGGEYPVAYFVNSFVLFFSLSAVPLMSAISGWLMFKGFSETPAFYWGRLRSRSRSILLPMILWNLLTLCIFLLIFFVSPQSDILTIITYDLSQLGPRMVADALVGLGRHPIDFQFWFLHDLFLTVMVMPILGFLLRRMPIVGIVVIGLSWFFDFNMWIFFRTDVLFFFFLGAYARVSEFDISRPMPRLGSILMAAFLGLAALRTVGPYFIDDQSQIGFILFDYGTRLMRLLGVVAIWLFAPIILNTSFGRIAASLGPIAFFLHAAHWPMNQFVKMVIGYAIPWRNDVTQLINYFATMVITVLLTFLLAKLLNGVAPKVFDIMSGGRSQALNAGARPALAPVARG